MPRLNFIGTDGKLKAALKIQSSWKGFKCAREFTRLKIMIQRVKFIQRSVRLHLGKRRTQRRIRDRN